MTMTRPILLVEDNPMDVDLTLRAFKERKLVNPIEVARDGEEALAWIPRWEAGAPKPVVILLDVNMPKVGGMMGFALAPTGRFAVPRIFRWLVTKDKGALAANLDKLAATSGLERVIVSHGDALTDKPADALRAAARELTGA